MTDIQAIFRKSNVAVITGAASGIGFAAAKYFASLGMSVAIADLEAIGWRRPPPNLRRSQAKSMCWPSRPMSPAGKRWKH